MVKYVFVKDGVVSDVVDAKKASTKSVKDGCIKVADSIEAVAGDFYKGVQRSGRGFKHVFKRADKAELSYVKAELGSVNKQSVGASSGKK